MPALQKSSWLLFPVVTLSKIMSILTFILTRFVKVLSVYQGLSSLCLLLVKTEKSQVSFSAFYLSVLFNLAVLPRKSLEIRKCLKRIGVLNIRLIYLCSFISQILLSQVLAALEALNLVVSLNLGRQLKG